MGCLKTEVIVLFNLAVKTVLRRVLPYLTQIHLRCLFEVFCQEPEWYVGGKPDHFVEMHKITLSSSNNAQSFFLPYDCVQSGWSAVPRFVNLSVLSCLYLLRCVTYISCFCTKKSAVGELTRGGELRHFWGCKYCHENQKLQK